MEVPDKLIFKKILGIALLMHLKITTLRIIMSL